MSELALAENQVKVFEKTRFSMCIPGVSDELPQSVFKSMILCGIEVN